MCSINAGPLESIAFILGPKYNNIAKANLTQQDFAFRLSSSTSYTPQYLSGGG